MTSPDDGKSVPPLTPAELAWFDLQIPEAFNGVQFLRAKYAALIKEAGQLAARTAMLTMLRNTGVFSKDDLCAIAAVLLEALIVQGEVMRAAQRYIDSKTPESLAHLAAMVATARAGREAQV